MIPPVHCCYHRAHCRQRHRVARYTLAADPGQCNRGQRYPNRYDNFYPYFYPNNNIHIHGHYLFVVKRNRRTLSEDIDDAFRLLPPQGSCENRFWHVQPLPSSGVPFELARLRRWHWTIENVTHYPRNGSFHEHPTHVPTASAPLALTALRSAVAGTLPVEG